MVQIIRAKMFSACAVAFICIFLPSVFGETKIEESKRFHEDDPSLQEMEQLKASVSALTSKVTQQAKTIQHLSDIVNKTSCSGGVPTCTKRYTVCPNGFVRLEKSCYRFFHHRMSFPEALTFCHAAGSHLVRTETRHEFDIVRNWVVSIKAQFTIDGAFVGASETHNEGQWEWVETLTPYTNIPWYPGQPDNNFNADCLVFWKGHNYFYGDIDCEYKGNFICEIE